MQFTYQCYGELLKKLREHGYQTADYESWRQKERCVILRHDVDNDIQKAVEMAAFEQEQGVASTYFVLLTSNFYNVFSGESGQALQKIVSCGHKIGLHFDEVRYPFLSGDMEGIGQKIAEEAEILGRAVGQKIDTVSMHRPSKEILEADLQIPGIINSYGKVFFQDFKYVSDSRRRWREPVEEIIASEQYERLHVLTHPFWYNRQELDLHDSVVRYVNGANRQKYLWLEDNITDLGAIMPPEEVL